MGLGEDGAEIGDDGGGWQPYAVFGGDADDDLPIIVHGLAECTFQAAGGAVGLSIGAALIGECAIDDGLAECACRIAAPHVGQGVGLEIAVDEAAAAAGVDLAGHFQDRFGPGGGAEFWAWMLLRRGFSSQHELRDFACLTGIP